MATYTKGFKKQSGDQVLLKAIIGIIVVVLVIVGIVFLYDLITDQGDYTEFSHIDEYDEILTQKDGSAQQIQEYLVYFYNADDEDCMDVQKEVLRLAEKLEADGVKIFLVDLDAIEEGTTGDKDDFLLAINKSTVFLNQSPMLLTVADGEFEETVIGGTFALELLNDVLDGDYAPFN